MKRFWLFWTLCLVCVNSLAAALYAGAPTLDDGSGFITLSPFVDCLFWGVLIAAFAAASLVCFFKCRPRLPAIPGPLSFPAAWLATLAGLSVLILLMGMCRLLYPYSPVHLPLWGYVGLMAVLYATSGFLWGRRDRGGVWSGLAWGVLIAVLLTAMGGCLIQDAHIQEAPWMAQIRDGSCFPAYTQTLLDSSVGAILARLNLPACVVMDSYACAHRTLDGPAAILRRDWITLCACLSPTILFTISWLLGRLTRPSARKRGEDHE